MELFLRSLKSITILRVTGEVTQRDIAILSVGLREKAPKKIPVLLDFEKSIFKGESQKSIESLLNEVRKEGIQLYIVSARLPEAYARTLPDALRKSGNPKADVINEVLELDKEIRELKEKKETLSIELKELEEKVGPDEALIINEIAPLEWLVKILEEAIERDRGLLNTFQEEVNRRNLDLNDLTETHQEVLTFLRSIGLLNQNGGDQV